VPRRASCAAGCSCASRCRRGRLAVRPCTVSRRARIVRAPLWAFSAVPCDARHRERRRYPRIRASLHYLDTRRSRAALFASASAAGCRPTGPPEARRGCVGQVRRRAHTMCARSLNVHGRTSSEPRSALADLEGRMPGRRAAGGVFLWLSFFAQALRRRSGANSAAGGGAAEGRMPGVKKGNPLARKGEWKLRFGSKPRSGAARNLRSVGYLPVAGTTGGCAMKSSVSRKAGARLASPRANDSRIDECPTPG